LLSARASIRTMSGCRSIFSSRRMR
jgi:hypothetical protein